MTTAEARRLFGNNNQIAKVLGINRSSVGRWGRMVPERHRETLSAKSFFDAISAASRLRK